MEVGLTLRLHVDVFRVLFLAHLLHAERRLVGVDVVEHVRVLVAAQPLVFPVEPHRQAAAGQLPQDVLVAHFS
jgi:hypothetical protein